jgi:hypothetical protein
MSLVPTSISRVLFVSACGSFGYVADSPASPLGRNLMVTLPDRGSTTPPAAVALNYRCGQRRAERAARSTRQPVEPAIYFSARQFPFREMFLTVRASDPGTAVQAVRRTLTTVTPGTPMGKAQAWRERLAAQTAEQLTIIGIAENALRRVLFEMSPRDPASLAAACVLLVAVAIVASVPPALRALRVDPVEGLRAE